MRSGSLHPHDSVRHLLLYKPLRCRHCRHRFWSINPLKPLLLLAAVGALVGTTAWLAQRGDPPAASVAARLPHLRAAQGDAEAQLQLAMHYAEGDGVVQDDKEAARLFELAAKQGLAEAEYQYGLALLHGKGVVQNYRSAFQWIEKPAQKGYARAQYTLGELYRYGTGTAIDKARAYLWFNLAAAQGVETAAKARDSLAWQLKPEQIAAMQEEAQRISRHPAPPANTAQAEAVATP